MDQTQIEPWMESLKEAVEAGLYRRDSAEGGTEPLPAWQHELAFTTPADCYMLLRAVAEECDFSMDNAASIIFHAGLRSYTEDRRRRSGGLWPDFRTNPAHLEQSRLLRRDYKRRGIG